MTRPPLPEAAKAAHPELGGARVYMCGLPAMVFEGRVWTTLHGARRERTFADPFEFTREALTGSMDYFGMRPLNAHHWMVILDALFDHREALLEGCMRRYGLAEHLIRRWCALDEVYRPSIIKAQPRGLRMGGEERPAEGFGKVTLAVGSLCDGCGRALPEGAAARYHLRTGALYCGQCDAQA